MASYINLVAFGTFGNPNGFRQTFFVGNKELAKEAKTFDLNTNAIKLFPKSKIYSIRKEYAAGLNSIAYSLYTFAKELNSERSGTFIGSSILFTEKISEENITLTLLNEFHSNLIAKNVQSDVITVNHSDKLSVSKPKEFEKIEYHLREIENLNFGQNTGNTLVVFTPTNDDILTKLFRKSIDLLNVYDTIYFTDSREVAEFVNQKGIFKFIQNVGDKLDFHQELQDLLEERKRKREQSISDFEREVQRLHNDKLNTINEFKIQIEQSEKVHKENELVITESKKDLETIEQFYKEFSHNIQELVNQLKSGKKLEEVKQLYGENKNRFLEGLSTLKRPNYIKKLPKNNPRSNLKPDYESSQIENRNRKQRDEVEEIQNVRRSKINIYKISSLVLLFLVILSWSYFLLSKGEQDEPKTQIPQINSEPVSLQVEKVPAPNTLLSLNPVPNNELNENDLRIVANNLVYDTKIEDVVMTIFEKNPSDIKHYYEGQESIYSKHIFELNKHCFEDKDGVVYFSKDTLRHIPSYKKQQ